MIFGAAGLSIDIGRVYIAKNEAQSFADSASLYGALEIDGTTAGLTRADSAVAASIQKWNFATTSFTGTTIEYSVNGTSDWQVSSWFNDSNGSKAAQSV